MKITIDNFPLFFAGALLLLSAFILLCKHLQWDFLLELIDSMLEFMRRPFRHTPRNADELALACLIVAGFMLYAYFALG